MPGIECAVSPRRELIVNGRVIPTAFPVIQAAVIGHIVVALFDPDADPRGYGTFPNLVAVDPNGEVVWTATLPTNETGDCYYEITTTEPLVARSIKSFDCTIDPSTGRLVQTTFTK